MPNHNTLTKNHVPYTGTFVDAAERLAAEDLTVEDIGKQYLQLDTRSLWQLESESPNPGWKALGSSFTPEDHKEMVAPFIHPPIRLQYPTEQDRLDGVNEVNGIVMTTNEIGFWAEQLDNHTFYKVVQLTPLTWKQVNAPYEETTEDIDIYINVTIGSDETGNGSIGAPWKTFTRAFRDIQHLVIKHKVTIYPDAGTYTEFPEHLQFEFRLGGRIIIDGSINPYPVVGTHSIQSIFDIGNPTPAGYSLATQLTVTPTLPTSDEPYFGKFMRFTSGNYNGKLLQVYTNRVFGPSTIRTSADYYGFQIGDTFDVVDYPVKIQVDHSITIKGNDLHEYLANYNANNFMVGAVEFKIGNPSDYYYLFLENLNANFAFCRLIDRHADTNDNISMFLSDVRLNMDWVLGGLFTDSNLTDLFTNGLIISGKDEDRNPAKGYDLVNIKNNSLGGVNRVFSRRIFISTAPSMDVVSCFCAGITTRPGDFFGHTKATIYALDLFLYQKAYNNTVLELSNCVFKAHSVYQDKGGLPLYLSDDSFFESFWYQGNTTYVTATEILRGSKMHITYPTNRTTIQGTNFFAVWEFDGSTTASKPGDGTFVQKADSFLSVQAGGGG